MQREFVAYSWWRVHFSGKTRRCGFDWRNQMEINQTSSPKQWKYRWWDKNLSKSEKWSWYPKWKIWMVLYLPKEGWSLLQRLKSPSLFPLMQANPLITAFFLWKWRKNQVLNIVRVVIQAVKYKHIRGNYAKQSKEKYDIIKDHQRSSEHIQEVVLIKWDNDEDHKGVAC